MRDDLYQVMLEELTEGHLALDRIGAPREIWDGLNMRELPIAERLEEALSVQKDAANARS